MTEPVTTFRRPRWVALIIAGLVTAGVVVWLPSQLGPRSGEPNIGEVRREVSSEPDAAIVRGAPSDPATALLGTTSSISPDPLELMLVATSPGRTSREGTASLGTDPRNPQTYAAGASLVNGAVIDEIYVDHVVLVLNGKRSVLAVSGKTIGRRLAQLISSSDAAVIAVGGEESVNRPLDTFPSSREDLSEVIRPMPFYEHDEFAGIKVLPGRDSSRFEVLGLQSGDIIRTIEGKPLKSVDAAWQTIDDALSTGTSIVASIERDGNLMSVYLDGSKLAHEAAHLNPPLLPGSPGI